MDNLTRCDSSSDKILYDEESVILHQIKFLLRLFQWKEIMKAIIFSPQIILLEELNFILLS